MSLFASETSEESGLLTICAHIPMFDFWLINSVIFLILADLASLPSAGGITLRVLGEVFCSKVPGFCCHGAASELTEVTVLGMIVCI